MEQKARDPSQLEERIDRIVTLATAYPGAAARVAMRFVAAEEKLGCFSLFCETIGIECAKLIFDTLPDYIWKLLDSPIAIQAPLGAALESLSRELLAECMEEPAAAESAGEGNPFAFVRTLSRERLARILRSFPVERVALMGAFMNRDEVAEVARAFGPEGGKRFLTAVTRLHRIPRAVLTAQSHQFAEALRFDVGHIEPPRFRTSVDRAIAELDLDTELELLARLSGGSQEPDERFRQVLQAMPSSDLIRAIVEDARQKISS